MQRIFSFSLLSLLIILTDFQIADSSSNINSGKNKSNYVILSINGQEYGKFGIKEDVPFLNADNGKTSATIGLGSEGFSISLLEGDVTATRGTILNLFLKNATHSGGYSFDGNTISGYDGSGTILNYRTGEGDTKIFDYSSGENLTRKPQGSNSCKTINSGVLGKTEVTVKQFTRNSANPKGIIEGNFSARLFGHSFKEANDCQSDRVLTISGYFYMNN